MRLQLRSIPVTLVRMWSKINNFFQQYVAEDDRLIMGLTIGLIVIAGVYVTVNQLTIRYHGIQYLTLHWLVMFPVLAGLYLLAAYARDMAPRIAAITRTYSLYYFTTVALALLVDGIQYTPFPLIDKHLVWLDRAMGFHTLAVLNWTYAHPSLQQLFSYAYAGLVIEMFFLPLVLAFCRDRQGVNLYFVTSLLAYYIGTTVYYFFPTAGPTVVFHSVHFTALQHDTSLKFFQIHHFLKPTTELGGMIAFPSFHVTWAVLLTYCCRYKKWLFWPLVLVNTLIILSTLFLAWHYLTDVVGAFVQCAIVIVIAEYVLNKGLRQTKAAANNAD